MNSPVQSIVGVLAGIWPRIAGFSGTPSLLVIALIANLVAVIPTAFRTQKDSPACDGGISACLESAPGVVPD